MQRCGSSWRPLASSDCPRKSTPSMKAEETAPTMAAVFFLRVALTCYRRLDYYFRNDIFITVVRTFLLLHYDPCTSDKTMFARYSNRS